MAKLDTYRKKRDFTSTPEPEADLVQAGGEQLKFLVQKHAARRLHYDFRLEWDGALLSWAVTKGPSADPSQKRLAVRTEDHPLSYGDFEGVIPKDNYGAGAVMLWDQGWWEPLHDPGAGLREGKLHFRLHGARMTGGWALVRMRGKGRENWLLIKERDEEAGRTPDALLNKHRRSVTTGRTMAEIARGDEAEPEAGHSKPRPRFRKAQLATLRDRPPEGAEWRHEAKFDGYRCLIAVGKGGVRLYTRNGKDWTDRFGPLRAPAAALDCQSALIDGEVIAHDRGDFSALQKALKTGDDLLYFAFDCLNLDGVDMTAKPLKKRRAALEKLLAKAPPRGPIRLSPIVGGDGAEALARICEAGGEGVVSKCIHAPYRGGRATAWIKSKCIRRAEFVVVGWSPSEKSGRPFASLLVGSYEDGELVYRGRVGSGFDGDDFDELQAALSKLKRRTPPFEDASAGATRSARWVTPKVVVETQYAEFTADGLIRHGVYKGIREDKEAMSVSAKAESRQDGASKIGGVAISHAGRVVFPDAKLTKGDVAAHYDRVAERLLLHAGERPASLLRCPDGVGGECFFQKHAGKGFPDAVKRIAIEEKAGERADYMLFPSREAILGAAQMGAIEFHIWGAAKDRLERPDRLVFDLDPDEGLGFDAVKAAAGEIREELKELGLPSAPMVTGGKGVHVVTPLRRISGWETVSMFARTFAHVMASRSPDRYTATMSKAKRKGRIFIDWLRNEHGATAIAPYAMRARPGAPVATPVSWEELGGLERADGFHPEDMAARLSQACPHLAIREQAKGIGDRVIAKLEERAG